MHANLRSRLIYGPVPGGGAGVLLSERIFFFYQKCSQNDFMLCFRQTKSASGHPKVGGGGGGGVSQNWDTIQFFQVS